MLLIELISISNMGVSLIKTYFCSRLYGKLGILWIPIWILIKNESTIKKNRATLLSDTGFNWDQNWVLLLPTVLLSMSIFSFQTRFLSIFGAKKWHGSSHLMRKKKISQALPSGPCSLAYTKMILALWPLQTTKESRSCIIWFPLIWFSLTWCLLTCFPLTWLQLTWFPLKWFPLKLYGL